MLTKCEPYYAHRLKIECVNNDRSEHEQINTTANSNYNLGMRKTCAKVLH